MSKTYTYTLVILVFYWTFMIWAPMANSNEISSFAKDLVKETEFYNHISDYIKHNDKLRYSVGVANIINEQEIGISITDNLEFLGNSDGEYLIKFKKTF